METWVGNYEHTDHETVRRSVFGFDEYRAGQSEMIDAALGGENVFATLPTGSGKSLCFELPAVMSAKGSVTLVATPLIALMRSHVAFLQSRGVPAIDLHSGRPENDRKSVIEEVRNGVYALVFLSPEQLQNRTFRDATQNTPITRLAVDEAHCIVKWGHDFRPEYLGIGDYVDQRRIPQVLAFTATASANAKREIRTRLKLENAFEYHGDIERKNLDYKVVKIPDTKKRKKAVLDNINAYASGSNEGVIVYCSTREDAEDIASFLKKNGLPAEHYHAGLEDYERREREGQFLSDERRILVSTNAFGMGMDKPNIRLIVHHRMPGDVEQYLQETGRAGRDGNPAHCVLIYHESDRNIHDHFIFEKSPSTAFVKAVYDAATRQYASSRQKAAEWFPLNKIGLYKSFTTGTGKESKSRDTQVNAAIDFMVEKGILVAKGGYFKLNPFPAEPGELQKQTDTRRLIAQAGLDQILLYANAEAPNQRMLIDLLEQEIDIP